MKSIMIVDGDIVISSKRMQLVEGTDQMLQRTKSCISVVKGELFYNADLGLDYTQVLSVTEKNIPDDVKKLAVIEATLQDTNVDKVTAVTIENDEKSRNTSITVQLNYKDGTSTSIGGIPIG